MKKLLKAKFLIPIILIASVVFWNFYPYYFVVIRADGISMSPTIIDGDKLIVKCIKPSALGKSFLQLRRGTIGVFYIPDENYFIGKRIIGFPGDNVNVTGQKVTVNREELIEPYVQFNNVQSFGVTGIVPDNHFFIMGDNREVSMDSRNTTYTDPRFQDPNIALVYNPNAPSNKLKSTFINADTLVGVVVFDISRFRYLEE